MKIYATILACFLFFAGEAQPPITQAGIVPFFPNKRDTLPAPPKMVPARQLDTIEVWRFVIVDFTKAGIINVGHKIDYIQMKEVRELHNEADGVDDPGFYYGKIWKDYWVHIKYLTKQGAPAPFFWHVIEPETFVEDREPEMKAEKPPVALSHRNEDVNEKGETPDTLVSLGWGTTLIGKTTFMTIDSTGRIRRRNTPEPEPRMVSDTRKPKKSPWVAWVLLQYESNSFSSYWADPKTKKRLPSWMKVW